MIDRLTVERIKEAARIEDVVGDFVVLKRAGANLKGLCPFHDDHSPSFMVSPAKNFCWCFACQHGGNPINFLMQHEQISYTEALRYLAKKYGITIEERQLTAEEMARNDDRESMFILNEWALKWFQDQLHNTPDGKAIGMAYFRSRGFRDDIIEKFQLGFCPSGYDAPMATAALAAGYKQEYLTNDPETRMGTGLCTLRDDGKLRDRFYGRVIFPIFTASGRPVGFGGRVLDAATKGVNVKYQNSPESIIYNKRRELYGLYQAKQAIKKQDNCYLVEGYTDVMAMHQSGVENVVASSGTALTDDQIRLIHRYTNNITVIYDGDAAGIKASQRGIDMLLSHGMNVKLLLLPDGDDPDSFARKHTAQEYQQYLAEHKVDFIRFKTDLLQKEAEGDPAAMSSFVNNIVQSIACIPDPITRNFYAQHTAATLRLDEVLIQKAVTREVAQKLKERQLEQERSKREASLAGLAGTSAPGSNGSFTSAAPAPSSPAEGVPDDFVPPEFDAEGNPVASPALAPHPDENAFLQQNQHDRHAARFEQKEAELAKAVVRYGEQVAGYCPDETTGEPRSLTVVEFFAYALQADGLTLRTPRYQRVLDLAMEHLHDENFSCERYFLNHDDPELSTLAFSLSADREELSRLHGPGSQLDAQSLSVLAQHLVTDYKLEIVAEEERALTKKMLRAAAMQPAEVAEVMTRLKELKDLKKELAKIGGDRVMG